MRQGPGSRWPIGAATGCSGCTARSIAAASTSSFRPETACSVAHNNNPAGIAPRQSHGAALRSPRPGHRREVAKTRIAPRCSRWREECGGDYGLNRELMLGGEQSGHS